MTSVITSPVTWLTKSGETFVLTSQGGSLEFRPPLCGGVHRNYLIEAREAVFVLADDQRLVAAFAIAGHLDVHRTIVGEYGPAAGAIV